MNGSVLVRRDQRRARLDGLCEPEHDSRLRDVLWPERGVEVGPRLDDFCCLVVDALCEAVPGLAAAVGDAPGADVGVAHLGEGAEEGAHRDLVGGLARARELDAARRRAVAASGVGERGVAVRDEDLRDRGHAVLRAAEAVQDDDAGPAAGRCRSVRLVEVVGDRGAVLHRPGAGLLRERLSGRDPEERREGDEQKAPHEGVRVAAFLQSRVWRTPGPSVSSTRESEA